MNVTLRWKTVNSIPEMRGHGIEVYYLVGFDPEHDSIEEYKIFDSTRTLLSRPSLFVAFVDGFKWKHGTSDEAVIEILSPRSHKFKKLGVDGGKVKTEIEEVLSPYLQKRELPPGDRLIGKHLVTHANA